jgi:hypothetical protein
VPAVSRYLHPYRNAFALIVERIGKMAMRRIFPATVCLVALAVAGCTTSPADYAQALSPQDPKWQSPECEKARMAALNYEAGEKKTMSLPAGLLLGPYGVGIALAGKQHQEKQRKLLARDMHLKCSSLPLPGNLEIAPANVAR